MIPILDLKRAFGYPQCHEAIEAVFAHAQFVLGPEVAHLEEAVAKYCNVSYAVGVSSGTDALLASLMACDLRPGDEVITTPFTFFATVEAILRAGGTPVFSDIQPTTYNIDPAGVEDAITARTRAIVPVHLYGQCADMTEILKIARRHDLFVVEDAAQSLGAEWGGKRAGSMGDFGCFSFFPSKNLGACGDGGMIVTNDPGHADLVRKIRDHGRVSKHEHLYVGGNFRLDTIQAAILLTKMKYVDPWIVERNALANKYDEMLLVYGTPYRTGFRHVFNQYVIQVQNRDRVLSRMKENGVEAGVYYRIPQHLQPCMKPYDYREGDFPNAEKAAKEVLALPIYPGLLESEQGVVVKTLFSAINAES